MLFPHPHSKLYSCFLHIAYVIPSSPLQSLLYSPFSPIVYVISTFPTPQSIVFSLPTHNLCYFHIPHSTVYCIQPSHPQPMLFPHPHSTVYCIQPSHPQPMLFTPSTHSLLFSLPPQWLCYPTHSLCYLHFPLVHVIYSSTPLPMFVVPSPIP